jgi:galactonate dehydratase
LYTQAEFRAVFEQGAADIINPDICNCGGILELKEIAAMAEPYSVAVSPHNYNSTTVGLAATAQLCATIPNFLITEYFVNFAAVGKEISRGTLVAENGYLTLPTAPGLGIDIDEAALARYAYQEFPPRTIRYPGDEGP